MAHLSHLQWRIALLAAVAPATAGCIGLSVPLGAGAPATTGSIEAVAASAGPLPAGLAPSDAAVIGAAARRALATDDGQAQHWQNPVTGSSGTLQAAGEAEEDGVETCRLYAATVASIKGVHRYACRACRTVDGGVTIRSIAAAAPASVRAAGI